MGRKFLNSRKKGGRKRAKASGNSIDDPRYQGSFVVNPAG